MIFASRTPMFDPLPWEWISIRSGKSAGRCTTDVPDRASHAYRGVFDPREKYKCKTTHPANPVLLDIRKYHAERQQMNNPKDWSHYLRAFEQGVIFNPWSASNEQIHHARRVLSRLANFTNKED